MLYNSFLVCKNLIYNFPNELWLFHSSNKLTESNIIDMKLSCSSYKKNCSGSEIWFCIPVQLHANIYPSLHKLVKKTYFQNLSLVSKVWVILTQQWRTNNADEDFWSEFGSSFTIFNWLIFLGRPLRHHQSWKTSFA